MSHLLDPNALIGLSWPTHEHRQITDAWLLTAAIRSGMKLLTFDAGISQLLANAEERAKHLVVLGS